MIRVCYLAVALLVIPCIVTAPCEYVYAQSDKMSMDPQKCSELQKQIDEVVAISEAAELSEQEKLNRLGGVVTQSLLGMVGAAKDLSDAAPILKEWNEMLTKLLASADASSASGNRDIPPAAQTGLDVAKNRVKPYVDMMKLMCPGLVLPQKLLR